MTSPPLAGDPAALGIVSRYRAADGTDVDADPDTVDLLVQRLGASSEQARTGALVLRKGSALPAGAREILTEDGESHPAGEVVGRTIKDGYHTLIDADGSERRLIVSPGRCHLPRDLAGWGWTAQLYAARSRASWGMGDLGDLATITGHAAGNGARFVLINPLHAPGLQPPLESSPYYASSRLYRNPLYLRIPSLPGAAKLGELLQRLDAEGRALNTGSRIDRDAVWALKSQALEALFAARDGDEPEFLRYRQACGDSLTRFARHSAIAEVHGPRWRDWPQQLQDARSEAVTAFAARHSLRVTFHEWLQWLTDVQVANAQPTGLALMQDLAVGVGPDGADAWAHPQVFVDGFRVGAPPDIYNTRGQDWGLPPFDPFALSTAGFAPFIEMFRAIFSGSAAVRIDHIMGMFRLWWVPPGAPPSAGVYVRYPHHELLDILALESTRASAFVVGEDLGTVERGVRAELRRRRILGYQLMTFGPVIPVERTRRETLTTISTHDLPTLAGLWSGSDLEAQRERNLAPNVAATERTRRHLARMAGLTEEMPIADVVERSYATLARSPARLIGASLDDAALTPLRPNMPGTVAPVWPNWEIPLPAPIEDVLSSPVAAVIARALGQ